MSNIIRSRVPGASIFFAVNLANRESDLSMREIETLRTAVKQTRAERPFPIDAWGMMKDHMHCLWTLPDGKAEYSVRWSAIKVRVSKAVRRAGFVPPKCSPTVTKYRYAWTDPSVRHHKGEVGTWERRFLDHHARDASEFRAHV
jgi:putative transposase